ncbi:hypothetical protein PHLCEN_2v3576 [Hermanssonia centrifuga]|uniref:DUF6533 domain-containing protein n=1 Tax=Hermanssonia centrifuga TaxID=98765 RepID=A0A2R6QEP0_9APHY|nr:hypothetical protein PHLCEN_2v3576 [Hermanssonia centrifuga]
MAALTAYEYIITFDQEIAAMWKRKWSLATWTFMANRYIMIIIAIWIVSPSTAQDAYVQQATVFTMDPGPDCETVLNVPANVEFE